MRGHYVDTVWHYAPDSKNVWRNRSESHVEKHRKRSFGAPGALLGFFGLHCGSCCILWVPLGDPSVFLWNPLGLLQGSFGAP